MRHYFLSVIFMTLPFFHSCDNDRNNNQSNIKLVTLSEEQKSEIETIDYVKYAEGFSLKEFNGVKLIDISDPSSTSKTVYRYALVPRNSKEQIVIPEEYQPIQVPVNKVICMTTLQLSPFIKLDMSDKIVGVTSTRFLHNKQLNARFEDGTLSRIGIEGDFDTEVVLSLSPELIFVSPYKRGGYDSVKGLNIPMLTYLGYKELSALGQAEWIKLVGLLLGEEGLAIDRFNQIESRYTQLLELVQDVESRPTVLSGELHSGNWYVVGGKSALAQQFRDAGADYFMQNDSESGGFYVDYETVYSQGHDADFWRIVNSFDGDYSYKNLESADSRYRDFRAYKNRNVIYCNLRNVPFYENTPMEPEVILADLIKIFHPELLPDHKSVYYYKLQQ
ncbi:MAG: ABC transporter substrate-binding protein [Rikenellaceae bacterium]